MGYEHSNAEWTIEEVLSDLLASSTMENPTVMTVFYQLPAHSIQPPTEHHISMTDTERSRYV